MGYPHKQPNDYTCGASALAYLLDTDPITAGKGLAPDDLAEQLGCDPENGTSPVMIRDYLLRCGVDFAQANNPMLGTIRLPMLVNYFDGEDGHWGVIHELFLHPAAAIVTIFDPSVGDIRATQWSEFVSHWYSPRYGKRGALWLLPPNVHEAEAQEVERCAPNAEAVGSTPTRFASTGGYDRMPA